jgi:hypothetical protein
LVISAEQSLGHTRSVSLSPKAKLHVMWYATIIAVAAARITRLTLYQTSDMIDICHPFAIQ